MVARVTLAEIDTVRTTSTTRSRCFAESVLPELHEQDGFEGCYVLTTPEGKALVLTFWATRSCRGEPRPGSTPQIQSSSRSSGAARPRAYDVRSLTRPV